MDQPPAHYRFSPRLEAHAMRSWSDLLPPVQTAVRDLLMRLAGAEVQRRAGPSADYKFGNCFLVYGARGTGKTTVLLSAREAVDRAEDERGFFGAPGADRAPLEAEALERAKELKVDQHIVWLDPLDLEPLPAGTNLLTTLLTRVRDALDPEGERDRQRMTSIFEESATDARQQLEDLINDATLMWEEIEETDTRSRAGRQRAAADIYASYRRRFTVAMDALSKKLDLRHSHDQGCAIVLPIDNIDRSAEHLKGIVKLAQMVWHPCLWLVMAGDRVEVETFLERAYWKELILAHEGTDARGKAAGSGEDETLGMARRQAHAAAQKVWPPSHRIEVNLVAPKDTLAFRPPESAEGGSLRELLAQVKVPTVVDHKTLDFLDLIELAPPPAAAPSVSPNLTLAAREGLYLPARGVLDLWQLAHWVATQQPPHGAVKMARSILRAATAASPMPSAMVQELQDKIIRRSSAGQTLLALGDWSLLARGQMSAASSNRLEAPPIDTPAIAVRSTLLENRSADMLLTLELVRGDEERGVALEDQAGPWLTILYDILVLVPELAVLGGARFKVPLVEARHDIAVSSDDKPLRREVTVAWPAPPFSTFLAHDIFWRCWDSVQAAPAPAGGRGTRLLNGWVRCALRTFALTRPGLARDGRQPAVVGPLEGALDDAESLYAEIREDCGRVLTERGHIDDTAMCTWLETGLPALLTRLVLPALGPQDGGGTLVDWLARHPESAMVAHWRANRVFLLADARARLVELFDAWDALAAPARAALEDWAFGDLRRALE